MMEMTERELTIAEWRRGLLSLRAATVLTQAGLYLDAVSRAYYAIRHATNAAVLTKGITVRTHRAGRDLLNQHLIHTAELERVFLDYYDKALVGRMKADYDVSFVFVTGDAELASRRAEEFTERIRVYLEALGSVDISP